jgi:hypothetical protein
VYALETILSLLPKECNIHPLLFPFQIYYLLASFPLQRSKMFEMSFHYLSYDTSKLGRSNNSLSNLFSEVAALVQTVQLTSCNLEENQTIPRTSKQFQELQSALEREYAFPVSVPADRTESKHKITRVLRYLRLGQYHCIMAMINLQSLPDLA